MDAVEELEGHRDPRARIADVGAEPALQVAAAGGLDSQRSFALRNEAPAEDRALLALDPMAGVAQCVREFRGHCAGDPSTARAILSRFEAVSYNRSLDARTPADTLVQIMAHFHRDAARRRVLDDVQQALTQDRTETILIRHKAPSIDHARQLATALTGPMGGLSSLPGLGRRRLPCSVRLVEGEGVVVEVAISA